MEHGWQIRARVQSEGDAHVQEDACGFRGPTAWVIDGATQLLEPLGLPAASDPQWLAETLSRALARSDTAAASGVRARLASALAAVDAAAPPPAGNELVRFPSAALSLAQLTDDGVKIAGLADCTVVVRTDDGVTHVVRAELADARVDLAAARTAADPARRLELLIRDRERRNTPGNLWVARREPEAAEHAHVVRLARPALLAMATDGAWRAVDLGLVSGPEEFLDRSSDPVRALQLLAELRALQADLGEVADDATVLALAPLPEAATPPSSAPLPGERQR